MDYKKYTDIYKENQNRIESNRVGNLSQQELEVRSVCLYRVITKHAFLNPQSPQNVVVRIVVVAIVDLGPDDRRVSGMVPYANHLSRNDATGFVWVASGLLPAALPERVPVPGGQGKGRDSRWRHRWLPLGRGAVAVRILVPVSVVPIPIRRRLVPKIFLEVFLLSLHRPSQNASQPEKIGFGPPGDAIVVVHNGGDVGAITVAVAVPSPPRRKTRGRPKGIHAHGNRRVVSRGAGWFDTRCVQLVWLPVLLLPERLSQSTRQGSAH
mmetsp:Transcript_20554/g.42240  ORF Transcript_20554/g.42240 Transcript_20554/m.42240 type:complete len:267 (+) Transcript_20554:947-1747(+)